MVFLLSALEASPRWANSRGRSRPRMSKGWMKERISDRSFAEITEILRPIPGGRTGIEPAFAGSQPALFPDEQRPRDAKHGRDGWIRTSILLIPNEAPFHLGNVSKLLHSWWVASGSNRALGGFRPAQSPDLLTTQVVLGSP